MFTAAPDIIERLVMTVQPGADLFGKGEYEGGGEEVHEQGCGEEQHQGKAKLLVSMGAIIRACLFSIVSILKTHLTPGGIIVKACLFSMGTIIFNIQTLLDGARQNPPNQAKKM